MKSLIKKLLYLFYKWVLYLKFHKISALKKLIYFFERYVALKSTRVYFDYKYYAEKNSDVQVDLVKHFINHGSKEGRDPSLLFNVNYYRREAMKGSSQAESAALHFCLIGLPTQKSPTEFFDFTFYAQRNADVVASNWNLYHHYCKLGHIENRMACDFFDPVQYCDMNPDVQTSSYSPVQHYILNNISLKNTDLIGDLGVNIGEAFLPRAKEETIAEILSLSPVGQVSGKIDVIIPVYGSPELTLFCILKVLKSNNKIKYNLIVIDDCSPDDGLSNDLEFLASKGYFTYLHNDTNLGFVATVNIGMKLSNNNDVVLLNSDTEVYNDWLDRMVTASNSIPNVATVTPISNNATIFSYPYANTDFNGSLEINHAEIDLITSEVNAGEIVEVPTAMGFCMLIKRHALNNVGFFDAKSFGVGYGEENDFSLRAISRGYINIGAPNIYVRHIGGASFKGEKAWRVKNAVSVLNKKYPGYDSKIQKFVKLDPFKMSRRKIDEARVLRRLGDGGRKSVLFVTHSRGGGTEQHVQEEIERLKELDRPTFRLNLVPNKPCFVQISSTEVPHTPNSAEYHMKADRERIRSLFSHFNIEEIQLHHLAEFGRQEVQEFSNLLSFLDCSFDYIVHDYLPVCPRINLINKRNRYCGEPDVNSCDKCLRTSFNEFQATSISEWRRVHEFLFKKARVVIVPNIDVKRRLLKYFNLSNIKIVEHEQLQLDYNVKFPVKTNEEVLRIGVLGAISSIKGLDKIIELSKCARDNNFGIQFVIIGYTSCDGDALKAGVEVTGAYKNDNVSKIVTENKIDAMFIPSIWPETYSYTLSISMMQNLPIFCFNLGAPPERLAEYNYPAYQVIDINAEVSDVLRSIRYFLSKDGVYN